jgi:surfactin synthase thioesterase subunit
VSILQGHGRRACDRAPTARARYPICFVAWNLAFSGHPFDKDFRMGSPWLLRHVPRPQASMRMFCFPYAGVGASVYRLWSAGLPEQVEVIALQLPGRESRLREPPLSSISQIVAAIVPEILPLLDRPYVFFGHSMGALLATELVRELTGRGIPPPEQLIVSGRRLPQVPDSEPAMASLPDEEFVAEINRRFGGIPAQVRHDRELMELLLPALRADIAALESHRPGEATQLECPIAVFGGAEDPRVPREQLEAWRTATRAGFHLRMFPGDHFYLNPHRVQVLAQVSSILAPLLADAADRRTVPATGACR